MQVRDSEYGEASIVANWANRGIHPNLRASKIHSTMPANFPSRYTYLRDFFQGSLLANHRTHYFPKTCYNPPKGRHTMIDKPIKSIPDGVLETINFDDWVLDNIINTTCFQRLRSIGQLGCCKYIFPWATHTRFEHSLGVGYIATEYFKKLAEKCCISLENPEVARMLRCLQISGICHDLGHGPYSHTFEQFFMNFGRLREDCWKHEEMSLLLVDLLMSPLIDCGSSEVTEEDVTIIKTLIQGVPPHAISGLDPLDSLLRAGFDVIANNRNGLDVDKFDYLKRDADLMLAGPSPWLDYESLMSYSAVYNGEIIYNAEELEAVWRLYACRRLLFEQIYTHKLVRAVDYMLSDSLREVDSIFNWSKIVEDPEEFLLSNDNKLLSDIYSCNVTNLEGEMREKLTKAQSLLKCVNERKYSEMYQFSGEISITNALTVAKAKELANVETVAHYEPLLSPDDIILDWNDIHYGTHSKNPFDCLTFYKDDDDEQTVFQVNPKRHDFSHLNFQEIQLRIYCKDRSKLELAGSAFSKFCRDSSLVKGKRDICGKDMLRSA